MAVFFVLFLFGHTVSCGHRKLWLDKLCIPQSDESVKEMFVRSLPDFVRRSSHMVVLWDESHLATLWLVYKSGPRGGRVSPQKFFHP